MLAGIRLAARDCTAQGNQMAANELLDIKAAVAELIEAVETILDPYTPVSVNMQYDNLRAALANVRPQS